MDASELRRALRGTADPELLARIQQVVAADPDSPFSKAVGALFGLSQGVRGAPIQRRKDLASVHLRQRRPKEIDRGLNPPLVGKSQAKAIAKLLRELAEALTLPVRQVPFESRRSLRIVHRECHGIVDSKSRSTIESEYTDRIVCEDDVLTVTVSISLTPDKFTIVPLDGIGSIEVDRVFSTTLLLLHFDEVLRPGDSHTYRWRMECEPLALQDNFTTLGARTAPTSINVSNRFVGEAPEVRRIDGIPVSFDLNDVFDVCAEQVKVSKSGLARASFVADSTEGYYGLAWRYRGET